MVIVYLYGISLLSLMMLSFYKGWLHYEYVYYDYLAESNDGDSFLDSFVPFGRGSALDQFYMLPYLPEKDPQASPPKQRLYRRIALLVPVLICLFFAAITPAVYSVI